MAARLIPAVALAECTERGFAAVSGLGLDAGALEAAMAEVGPLTFTPGERPHPDHPYTFVVTNRGRTTPPRSVFHSDTSYVEVPPSYTALAAVEVPEAGGETVFVNQFEALTAAPASLRAALEGVEFLHVATRVADAGAAGEGAWHPALRLHPALGRAALYVSARERLAGARRRGRFLGEDEARELIDAAHAQATTGAPVERHAWRAGDLLLTDNRSTLHAADHAGVVGARTLHRVMVRGERPVAAA